MSQYRIPEAQQALDCKIAHLRATNTPFTQRQRREGSPWVVVSEGCPGNACPFGCCEGCGWSA